METEQNNELYGFYVLLLLNIYAYKNEKTKDSQSYLDHHDGMRRVMEKSKCRENK